MNKYLKAILLFLFINSVNVLFAEAVTLKNLISGLGAELEWEPVRDTARIIKDEKSIVLKLGSQYYLMGDNIYYSEELMIRNDEGAVLIPENIAEEITAYFTVYGEYTALDEDSPKIAVVLLDPGHGGKDPGAIGEHSFSISEKNVVLEVADRIRALLMNEYPSKQILLTRNNDTYLTLEQRTEMANSMELDENEAIIFISIHANASVSSSGHGFEIWYLPPEYERELIDEVSLEPEYMEIKDILNQMLDAEYTLESMLLAKEIELGLDAQIGTITKNRGLKEENWFVVRKSKMPSVLIEVGFVTNPEEAARLNNADYLQQLAVGIYNGIKNFIYRYEDTRGFTE